MRTQNTNGTAEPLVVGTIYSAGSLRRALKLKPGQVDLLEVRVDHFAEAPDALLRACADLPAPLIITVRRPEEGGAGGLRAQQRVALYDKFLSVAAYVDVEVCSLPTTDLVISIARGQGVQSIVSDHYFQRVPSELEMRKSLLRAWAAEGNIVKLAARVETAADLQRLTRLFDFAKGAPVSVMGMGPLGKVSRLLFARLGSRLNYGYLDEPQVSGQWEATQLKQRVEELFAE